MTNQHDRELMLLSTRLNTVRHLLRERAYSTWALDYWRTVEQQLERRWNMLSRGVQVYSTKQDEEQSWML
jgi:hypothetical protein